MDRLGVFEDGQASGRVVDFMEERMLHTARGVSSIGGRYEG